MSETAIRIILALWVLGAVHPVPLIMTIYFGEHPEKDFRVRHLVYILFWPVVFLVCFPLYWLWLGLGEFRKFLKRGW